MSISFRDSIRWLPDDAAEPTSTMVLTSPARRFVDVRIHSSTRAVDWAFAGTSSAAARTTEDGRQVSHLTFRHWVDSRTEAPEEVRDEGDMMVQPDGRVLETGRMVNPVTGEETDYEEVWRDADVPDDDGAGHSPADEEEGGPLPRCVVLQLHDDARRRRGMAILLGPFCQGVLRDGSQFTVQRWEWTAANGWEMSFKAGDGALPCRAMIRQGRRVIEQGTLAVDKATWNVVESQ